MVAPIIECVSVSHLLVWNPCHVKVLPLKGTTETHPPVLPTGVHSTWTKVRESWVPVQIVSYPPCGAWRFTSGSQSPWPFSLQDSKSHPCLVNCKVLSRVSRTLNQSLRQGAEAAGVCVLSHEVWGPFIPIHFLQPQSKIERPHLQPHVGDVELSGEGRQGGRLAARGTGNHMVAIRGTEPYQTAFQMRSHWL